MTPRSKKWAYLLAGMVGLSFLYLLVRYDPSESHLFLQCPIYKYTGLQCPGCGSQRAIHDLLHGQIKAAWGHHPLLVLSIPYLLAGFLVEIPQLHSARTEWVRRHLYGKGAALIALVVIVFYTLLRNMW